MAVEENVTPQRSTRWYSPVDMSPRLFLRVALVGIIVGVLFWALVLFLNQSVISPAICSIKTTATCSGVDSVSSGIASVIGGLVGLFGLVRLGIFRPLYIVSASAVLLWGMGAWTKGFLWYESLFWQVFLYAVTYLAFSWLARLRIFGIVLIISAFVIIAARIVA